MLVSYTYIFAALLSDEIPDPRDGHGDSHDVFEVPNESTCRLDPPSTTKSVYPFGINGTLAWVTPAGELLQVASCIRNKLMAAEYKKSIDRGAMYHDRGKMLEIALNQAQGSGFGIGLSLGRPLELVEQSWLYNRWPRFHFRQEALEIRQDALEIRLQYYIDSQSVIQDFLVRNTGQEEASLPYILSSDICFREHDGKDPATIHSVPTGKSPERLLLFQNSEVLIRNEQCQLTMTLFLNGQRQPLWTDNRQSDEDDRKSNSDRSASTLEQPDALERKEDELRKAFLEGRLGDDAIRAFCRYYDDRTPGDRRPGSQERGNFARSSQTLVVPGGSTQELRAIIQISSFPHQENLSNKSRSDIPELEPNSEANISPKRSNKNSETSIESIRAKLKRLTTKMKEFSLKPPNPKERGLTSEMIDGYLGIGKAYAKIELLGEAQYHLFTATLIAEVYFGEGSQTWSDAMYVYAQFLNKHGWCSSALKIMEQLFNTLSIRSPRSRPIAIHEMKLRIRLAFMYLEQGSFDRAEKLYKDALLGPIGGVTDPTPVIAHCLERIAWAQVHRERYTDAHETYKHLSAIPGVPRRAILSNLAFLQGKLGNWAEAKSFFESALLHSSGTSEHTVQQLYARSGLFACLRRMDANPEDTAEVAGSLIPYPDVISPLFRSTYHKLPIKDGPFHFAITRQLESLLTTCSIPVDTDKEVRGIAFVDADPLNCGCDSRFAYFQFRFLTQCQKLIDEWQEDADARLEASERIKAACRGHLVWVFKIAKFSSTWERYSYMGDNPVETEKASDEPTVSRPVEGAFQFSKLWFYLRAWDEEWHFVFDLLHLRLDEWLSYLRNTQHMSNLWVEREDRAILKPHDSISSNSGSSNKRFPRYHLCDFTALWLALKQLGVLIDLIERCFGFHGMQDDSARSRLSEVRQTFEDYQKSFSIHDLRSNIIRTFMVPKQGEVTSRPIINEKVITISKATSPGEPQANGPLGASDASRLPNTTGTKLESPDHLTASGANQAIIASQRTINEYNFEIQSEDITTIEAATAGFFEQPRDHVYSAWQETLKVHEDIYIPSFEDPRQIALTLFAAQVDCVLTGSSKHETAKTIVGDAAQPMRSWSAVSYETLFILMASIFEECRTGLLAHNEPQGQQPLRHGQGLQPPQQSGPSLRKRKSIVMPRQVGAPSDFTQVILVDELFLPDWMYHYSEHIHVRQLDIDIEAMLEESGQLKCLENAVDKRKDSKAFGKLQLGNPPFPPHVADVGTKKGADRHYDGTSVQRPMKVDWYWDPHIFYERLVKPRTFLQAKKRLIELASHDQETTLICWLTTPRPEKPLFLDFLDRHCLSESFFGERVDWRGNIWDTEFHLGFYQMVSKENNKRFPPHMGHQSQLDRIKKMPNLSDRSDRSDRDQITLVAVSLRFVGDLRDRSWTCHYLSSVAREFGFTGLANECTDSGSYEDFYKGTMGQRKLLELSYVERMLREMEESSDGILVAFRSELKVPETRDLENESYELIHNYSRLHSKAEEILHDCLQQLNLAILAIQGWERRADTKLVRSRWSQKDEERYGQKLLDLTRKCRHRIQHLGMRKNDLEEQQNLAKQKHDNLINYMQLQEARTSSRSAEDVRLFTYVTIIFLPLTFSSSLFSMQGAPGGGTIIVMVPTTVVALAVTVVALSNMKVLARNWNFWVYKHTASARKKMAAKEHSWGVSWEKISRELEKSAQLRLTKPENEKRLPAESKWWYFLFCLSYIVSLPRLCVVDGVSVWKDRKDQNITPFHFTVTVSLSVLFSPACAIVFTVQLLVLTAGDALGLVWKATQLLGKKIASPRRNEQPQKKDLKNTAKYPQDGGLENGIADAKDEVYNVIHKEEPFKEILRWLQSPPRPIRKYTSKLDASEGEPKDMEPMLADSEPAPKDLISNDGDDMLSDKEWWEIAIEKNLIVHNNVGISDTQPGESWQVEAAGDSNKEKARWWTRRKTSIRDGETAESEV
ncbi:MAG: hypothetical protein Q9181_006764 [Wetmoreana brouardii]